MQRYLSLRKKRVEKARESRGTSSSSSFFSLLFLCLSLSLSLSLSSASRSLKNHTSTTHKMKFVSSISVRLCYINVIRTMFPDVPAPITLEIRVIKVITWMEDTFSCSLVSYVNRVANTVFHRFKQDLIYKLFPYFIIRYKI